MITAIKSSKTLTIEIVSNGWIVRPYPDFSQNCCTTAAPEEVSCYTRIEELQRSLPALLGVSAPVKASCLNGVDSSISFVDVP